MVLRLQRGNAGRDKDLLRGSRRSCVGICRCCRTPPNGEAFALVSCIENLRRQLVRLKLRTQTSDYTCPCGIKST